MGKNHGVAVTVRHEYRQVDRAYSLQHAVIRNFPCTNGVVLSLSGFPRGGQAEALGSGEHALEGLLPSLPARGKVGVDHVKHALGVCLSRADRLDNVGGPTVVPAAPGALTTPSELPELCWP